MSEKNTPIDKVRAALEYAAHEATNDYWREQYKKTLSLLEDHVIVPVEPTVAMGLAWNKAAMDCASYFSTAYYKAMIAPYVKGGAE